MSRKSNRMEPTTRRRGSRCRRDRCRPRRAARAAFRSARVRRLRSRRRSFRRRARRTSRSEIDATHFLATSSRGGAVGDDRGMEERREQAHVQRIADGGAGIRMNQPRAADERRERRDAVRRQASILARAAHDDRAADRVDRARARDAGAQPAIEHAAERQHERGCAAVRRRDTPPAER